MHLTTREDHGDFRRPFRAFVRIPEGFAKRQVVLGQSDDYVVEIVSGLRPGETNAVGNTFPLKAELLKAQTED